MRKPLDIFGPVHPTSQAAVGKTKERGVIYDALSFKKKSGI